MSSIKNLQTLLPELSTPFIYLILALVALFAFIKWFSQRLIDKESISLKRLEIADSLFNPKYVKPCIKERYLTEQWFTSTYDVELSYQDIVALLSANNPSKACRIIKYCLPFVEFSKSGKSFCLNKSHWGIKLFGRHYKWRLFLSYVLLYFIFAMIGAVLLLFGALWVFNIYNGEFSSEAILSLFLAAGVVYIGGMFVYLAIKVLNRSNYISEVKPFLQLFEDEKS